MAAEKKERKKKVKKSDENEPLLNADKSRGFVGAVWDGVCYLALCECFSCSCLFVEGGKLKPASNDPFT
eukprot:CAMPEP_0181310114 /NCGR_PEP_ID=MMETSP1101-20121128/12406_1 /TAXON_ID=46948 /ORGANISM="Rhodomonas abbreviata, Strain Caron Lab Isolate" /LENGTH=68 /DNA_ID=CAMNT_0023416707 /DNA_START=189 /DNA_END=395 /DNA_ORIENTATION=-